MPINQFPSIQNFDPTLYKTANIGNGTTAVLSNGILNTILSVTGSGFIKCLQVTLTGTAPSGSLTTRGFAVKITIDDVVVFYKKHEINSNGTHPAGLHFCTTDGVVSATSVKNFNGVGFSTVVSTSTFPSLDGGTLSTGTGINLAHVPQLHVKFQKNFKIETQYYPTSTETYAVNYIYSYYTL